jgi:hypothetical protein
MPLLASDAMKPKLRGPLMSQREKVTGIDPATCSEGPSLRPETVMTTGREIPCIARRPVTRSVTVAPEAKAAFSLTGRVSVTVANGCLLVPRLSANWGCAFPPAFMLVRPIRNAPPVTRSPEITMTPVTALVRPTVSLLMPRALSRTRNPASEPAAATQVPSREPVGKLVAPVGRASGAEDGCSDLVKELARKATPTIVSEELELIRQVVAEHLEWLETPELRHRLVVELLRRLSLLDFQTLYGSPDWRTYLALHATFLSISDEDLRGQVQAALARSERDHVAKIASAWERLVGLLGYRLRPETGVTFETTATLVDAAMRGLVMTALSMPEVATYRARARPLGAAATDEWSLPGLALASVALAFLEPDPAVEWDAERIASVRHALAGLAIPGT